ncbi:hypothetical protein [Nitrosovibrio sp. Nv6]|uniref:hypothetical protein n=1 Tax=Nitrosovibrio sp. Nv6 TaxID=1855340 RepID=UPI0008AA9DF4|nr:hypothetical protein [Nitrosovibrio sp. Nv6]SEP30786.1 hypothetical protein SAMN05216316_2337 [Nitrosovibrio sp. Nv6]
MTNNSDEAPSEPEYDEILRKLDALLRKHQSRSSASAPVEANDGLGSLPPSFSGALDQTSLSAADNIPTLNEIVYVTPPMLSPQSDITLLLEQVLDSALKDAGIDLEAGARKALVQALESHLFGL